MRLISWNIKLGGGKRIEAQVKALCSRRPDIIALQEITPDTVPIFCELFEKTELKHIKDSFPRCGSKQLKGGRQLGEMIASRWELKQIASTEFGTPWPEKVLSVLIDEKPWGKVEIHTVHLPNGSNHGWTKIEMFEAIYKRLACNVRHHRILCGDFNSPLEETADGQIRTCGQDSWSEFYGRFIINKTYRDKHGRAFPEERWDVGERNVLEGLRRYDLTDVFRFIHGYKKGAFSYYTNNRGKYIGRRFDHIFASASLKPQECNYLTEFSKKLKLSDHAPLEAVFKPEKR